MPPTRFPSKKLFREFWQWRGLPEPPRAHVDDLVPEKQDVAYSDYLKTSHWEATRKDAIERAGHKCQLCGKDGGALNVHHNNYDHLWQETEQDLIVLCRSCHSKYHNKTA